MHADLSKVAQKHIVRFHSLSDVSHLKRETRIQAKSFHVMPLDTRAMLLCHRRLVSSSSDTSGQQWREMENER